MRSFVGFIFLLVTAAVLVVFLGQRKIIFPAPQVFQTYDQQSGVELIQLSRGHAYLALPTIVVKKAPLIVFAHGNAELAQWSIESFSFFRDRGFAILLLEYPGYGGSAGAPSERSIEQSALAALDQVVNRDEIDGGRIIAYGRSVGSGVACRIGTKRDIAALVLESPFLSMAKMASGLGVPEFLVRDNFDNAQALAAVSVPVFLYHGTRDTIIPFSHSERLSQIANDAVLVAADCGHNDCPRPWHEMLEFFKIKGLYNE